MSFTSFSSLGNVNRPGKSSMNLVQGMDSSPGAGASSIVSFIFSGASGERKFFSWGGGAFSFSLPAVAEEPRAELPGKSDVCADCETVADRSTGNLNS